MSILQPDTDRSSSSIEHSSGSLADSVIPVIREELEVGKKVVETGTVRLTKSVQQRPETVSELLASEHVEVERIPRNEIVNAAPVIRTEGDVTIIPIVEEVLVITKQLRLKEELRITRKQVVREYREEVILLSEDLTVERFGAGKSA